MSMSTGQFAAQTPNAPKSTAPPHVLTLYIEWASVGIYVNKVPAITNQTQLALSTATAVQPQSTGYLGILTGELDAFQRYSLQEHSGWLLDIAHDICDPLLKQGTLQRWDTQFDQLVPVSNADVLQAGSYLYVLPPGVVVALSKMSERQNKSQTSVTGKAATMKNRVLARDGRCWITKAVNPLINSHIVPKRLGDLSAQFIVSQFCPDMVATNVFNTIFGIALSPTIDKLFDYYDLGFRCVSPNVYDCHVFAPDDPGSVWTILGSVESTDSAGLALLHRRRVSAPRPTADNLPPAGLFRWNYMQCVMKHFSHSDYCSLPNIVAQTIDIKIYDEDDTDSDCEGPADWPTAAWDLGRLAYAQQQEEKSRQDAVARWVAAQ